MHILKTLQFHIIIFSGKMCIVPSENYWWQIICNANGKWSLGQHQNVNAMQTARTMLCHNTNAYLFVAIYRKVWAVYFLSFPFVSINCINMKIDYSSMFTRWNANVWDRKDLHSGTIEMDTIGMSRCRGNKSAHESNKSRTNHTIWIRNSQKKYDTAPYTLNSFES